MASALRGAVPDIAKLKRKLGSFPGLDAAHKSMKDAANKHIKTLKDGINGALGSKIKKVETVDKMALKKKMFKDAALDMAKMKEASKGK